MVEDYSRELSSAGFWPGEGEEAAFYAYAYAEPAGFADRAVIPDAAYYSVENGQFLLPYEAIAESKDPDRTLAQFLHTTYAAADLGAWDRAALADDPARWLQHGASGHPRRRRRA